MYKEVYNDFFKKHGDNIHYAPDRFTTIASLCRGKVLDLGCGTGDLLDFYTGEYVGVDVSDVALNMAVRKFGKKGQFICTDLTKEKLEIREPADTVVLAEFLEHIREDEFDIKELLNYIKPDGRIIIGVPNADRVPDKWHVREFTIPKLRRMFSPLGEVKFYNWVGAEKRILMSCDIGKENKKQLSLCMILKNEAKGLEKAVMSAIEIVDEVVIFVDDTSNDNTLKIAEKFGDIVKSFTWQNDFSHARNICQAEATCEWVMHLDGHEYIDKVNFSDFSEYKDNDGIWCRITYETGLSFRHPRIVRKEIQWRDAVHNSILCKNVAKVVALSMIHDRDSLQSKEASDMRNEQRKEMISKIMGERIEKNKKDIRALFYYAVHLQSQKEYFRAIKLYKRYLKYSRNTGERWYTTLNIAVCFMLVGKARRAFYWAQLTEKEIPHRWENSHICGVVLMRFGRYERALDYLVEAMKDDKRSHTYNPIARDIGEIWDMIGTCFINLQQYPKARVAFERAMQQIKDQKKAEMIKAKYSALVTLEKLQQKNPISELTKKNRVAAEQSVK